jgi:SNF2 family DNA or RNA helicase
MSLKNHHKLSPELKKLLAYELTQLHPQDSIEAASRMVGEARIDPNPHQIEAAIYGYKALKRGGAILADEVGLGKTIEAGLILNQFWAEGRRHILVVAPVALRAQWQKELESLFYLPSTVISTDEWHRLSKEKTNPILRGEAGIFIVSDHLVFANQKTFSSTHWDLVVIDEAHRLRNVYRKGKNESQQAKRIRDAFTSVPKLLLTATPFQNSLDELYGLISLIDQNYFGSFESFQRLYSKPSKKGAFDAHALRERMTPIFRRTLRRDVSHYLVYTQRKPVTVHHDYDASSEEDQLSRDMSTLLTSDYLLLNNKTSRGFFDLIYLKLLGSSPYALNPALLKMIARFLQGLVKRGAERKIVEEWIEKVRVIFSQHPNWEDHHAELASNTCKSTTLSYDNISNHIRKNEDYAVQTGLGEEFSESAEEWGEDAGSDESKNKDLSALSNPRLLEEQLKIVVKNYFRTSRAHKTGRAKVFLETLKKHVSQADDKKYSKKAVVFTEYVRTMNYVADLVRQSGFNDFEVVTYHGGLSNKKGADGLSERDRALERFRHSKKAILIATEAGAEGLNLQFCNLLINYDLPWNPQRIEQRIGRCHRYGQKNDVVVVNFVCEQNQAEKHIFRILSEKFKLFDGVFGASNSILGAIQSGADLEKLFGDIYLGIRSAEQAEQDLETFLETSEQSRKSGVHEVAKKLLEEFDPEVTKILKVEWEKLKDEVSINLTLQERKLADLVLSEIPGSFESKRYLFAASENKYPILHAKQHTFQRIYANDDLPLITPRHSEISSLINELQKLDLGKSNSYNLSPTDEITKSIGPLKGAGYWLFGVHWKVSGASPFEHIGCYLLEPNGNVVDSPVVRKIVELLQTASNSPQLHAAEAERLLSDKIQAIELDLSGKREDFGQQIYIDRITIKQKAIREQEAATDQIRQERRQLASEFDLAILKAPMKDKTRIMKERDSKLKDLDAEIKIYTDTIAALEDQEKQLHKELTSEHEKGTITRKILFKTHLEFT